MPDPESQVKMIDLLALEDNPLALAVGSASVKYTKSFLTPNFESAAIELRFDGAGSVDVKVEVESGNAPPTTEGAAVTEEWGVGNTVSSGITNKNTQFLAPSPTVSKYLRFKLTGQGSNAASIELRKLKFHYTPND